MFIFALFIATDLVIIGLAIPLLRRKVPPNALYGFRVEATFADEWVWYEANALSGRDMIRVGVVHLVLTLLLLLVPLPEPIGALGSAAILVIGLIVVTITGSKRANRLLKMRRAGVQPR